MHTPTAPLAPRPPGRLRRRELLALTALSGIVALVHGLLMSPWHGPGDRAHRSGEALTVRHLAVPAPRPATGPAHNAPDADVALPMPVPAKAAAPTPPPRPARVPMQDAAAPAPQSAVATASAAPAASSPDETTTPATVTAVPSDAAPAENTAGTAPPVYAMQAPPSLSVDYAFRRGALSGQGRLTWQVEGDRYAMALEATGPLAGTLLTQRSSGVLTDQGVVPQRFTDWRRRRSERAVNFEPGTAGEPGRIQFSSNAAERPFWPGTQDRLSWMAQLAGIVRAWPGAPPAPGTTIEIDVAGAAGDVQRWQFEVLADEAAATPALLKLQRRLLAADGELPPGRAGTRVQVWLDPQRHYLPERVLWSDGNGDPVELRATAN